MKPLPLPLSLLLFVFAPLSFGGAAEPAAEKKVGASGLVQSRWVQSSGQGGFVLGSEKIREQLGLSEEQEKEIAALVDKSLAIWRAHSDASMAARDETSAAAFAILTDAQRESLKKMKTIEGSWFQMIGNERYLQSLGLSEEKVAQIVAINEAHKKERSAAFQSVAQADPDAAKKAKEFQEKHRKMLDEVKGEIREILDTTQFDTLLSEVAQTQFQRIFQQKGYEKELALSEEQKGKLTAWLEKRNDTAREIGKIADSEERVEKWRAWREESGAEAFAVLTIDQQANLKKMGSVESMWFSALSWPGVIEKLGLTDEGRKKLDENLKGYQKKRSEAFRPSSKVAAKSREVQAKYKTMVADAKSEIRELLSDVEFDEVLTKIASNQLPYGFRRKDIAEELKLTDDQVKKLEVVSKSGNGELRERTMEVWAERRKLQEQAESLLTPDQKKKLKELAAPRPLIRVKAAGQGGE